MNIRHTVSHDANANSYSLLSEAYFGIAQHFTEKAWNALDQEKIKKDAERLLYTSVYNDQLVAVVHLYKRLEVMRDSLLVERPDLADELSAFLQFLGEIRALMRTPK